MIILLLVCETSLYSTMNSPAVLPSLTILVRIVHHESQVSLKQQVDILGGQVEADHYEIHVTDFLFWTTMACSFKFSERT